MSNTELKVGDRVKVMVNVDHYGNTGEIVFINESDKHPIEVQFEDGWVSYLPDEIEKQ